MKFLWMIALCSVLALGQDGRVVESMEVHLHKVIVRVADKDGNPIEGLNRNQFRLKQKRTHIQLSHFEEINEQLNDPEPPEIQQADVPPPEKSVIEASEPVLKRPGRTLAVIFDTSAMTRRTFRKTKPQLAAFLQRWLQPDDEILVTQMESGLKQLGSLTNDPQVIQDTVTKVEYGGRFLAQLNTHQDQINDILELMMQPGGNTDSNRRQVNRWVEMKAQLKRWHLRSFTGNARLLGHYLGTREGSRHILWVTSAGYLDHDTDDELEEVTRELNNHGVVIHTLLVKDKVKETASHDVPLSVLSDLGSVSGMSTASKLNPNFGSMNTIVENAKQLETAPFNAAVQTGGAFLRTHNFATLPERLTELGRRANHYYILWYNSEEAKRKLTLDLAGKQKGWVISFGKESEPPKPYKELKGASHQVAFGAALLFEPDKTFVDSDFNTAIFGTQEKGYQIAVHGFLGKDNPPGEYELGLALLDEDNNVLAQRHHVLTTPKPGHLPFYDMVFSKEYPHKVRGMVTRMDNGKRTLKTLPLDRHFATADLSLSSILLANHDSPMALKLKANMEPKKKKKKRKKRKKKQEAEIVPPFDPFVVGDEQVTPCFQDQFEQADFMTLFFQLQNRKMDGDHYEVAIAVVKEEQALPANLLRFYSKDVDGATTSYLCDLDTKALDKGSYTLYIRVIDKQGKAKVIGTRQFEVLG